jgi:hypothetical protein
MYGKRKKIQTCSDCSGGNHIASQSQRNIVKQLRPTSGVIGICNPRSHTRQTNCSHSYCSTASPSPLPSHTTICCRCSVTFSPPPSRAKRSRRKGRRRLLQSSSGTRCCSSRPRPRPQQQGPEIAATCAHGHVQRFCTGHTRNPTISKP